MKKHIIVAIDGYSSCGKSTLAKAIAQQLHFIYVDSGAMYRAVTYYFIKNKIEVTDMESVQQALENIHISFDKIDNITYITLNEEDITEEIREMYISDAVSTISAIKEVRQAMVKLQQKLGSKKNIVMDGRDIGSVVFPAAQVKFFMTAKPEIRAKRRYEELQAKGNHRVTLEQVFENLAHRDYTDTTRNESPLTQTDDAIVLDNSHLSEAEQLQFAIAKIKLHL